LAVTVAHYLTPVGRDIQSLGITPDLALTEPEPLNTGGKEDQWLEAAQTMLVRRIESSEFRS
jgi:carboxyl-terminal processing protease